MADVDGFFFVVLLYLGSVIVEARGMGKYDRWCYSVKYKGVVVLSVACPLGVYRAESLSLDCHCCDPSAAQLIRIIHV